MRSLNIELIHQRNHADKKGQVHRISNLSLGKGDYGKLTIENWEALSQNNIKYSTFTDIKLIPEKF